MDRQACVSCCPPQQRGRSIAFPILSTIVASSLFPFFFLAYSPSHENVMEERIEGGIRLKELKDTNLTLIQNNSRRKIGGGRLILHIGPPKTASTTLQDDLGKIYSQVLLQQDEWLYLGKRRQQQQQGMDNELISSPLQELLTSKACQRELLLEEERKQNNSDQNNQAKIEGNDDDGTCWSNVRRELKRLQSKKIILSEEGFVTLSTTNNIGPLWVRRVALELEQWNVVIVAVYRHYEAAVMSDTKYYNTHNALGKSWTASTRSMWSTLQKSMAQRRHANSNPPQNRRQKAIMSLYRDFDDALPLWQEQFGDDRVILLNLENSTDYITCQFLCHPMLHVEQPPQQDVSESLLTPSKSCQVCREHLLLQKRKNVKREKAKKMDPSKYDPILVEAARRGIINATLQERLTKGQVRREYERLVEQGVVVSWQQMPLICPLPEEISDLWLESWRYERTWMLLRNKSSIRQGEMESAHRAVFQQYVDRSYFCDVNTTALLHGVNKWDEFLLKSKQWATRERKS